MFLFQSQCLRLNKPYAIALRRHGKYCYEKIKQCKPLQVLCIKNNPIFKSSVTKFLLALTALFVLTACTGGQGSGNSQSITGQSGDAFISDATLEEVANSLDFVTPIAYVRRPLQITEGINDPLQFASDNLDTEIDNYLELTAFNPGARLYLRAGADARAAEFNLTDRAFGADALYDIRNVTVSSDGERLLFAMHAPEVDPEEPEFTWNIWEYNLTSNSLRQITFDTDNNGDLAHDIDPIYLPNNDILFASTRQSTNKGILVDEGKSIYSGQIEEVAGTANEPNHSFNLHIIDATINDAQSNPEHEFSYDTGSIRQLTFNQSHEFSPLVLDSGNVVFVRWDNIAGTDTISLYEINPSNGNAFLKYGYHSIGDIADGGLGYPSQLRKASNGKIFAITRELSSTLFRQGGDIVEIDVENFIEQNQPTFNNAGLSTTAIASQTANPVAIDQEFNQLGRFLSAWRIESTGELLVSWLPCRALNPDTTAGILDCTQNGAGTLPAPPITEIWKFSAAGNPVNPIVTDEVGSLQLYTDVLAMEAIPQFINQSEPGDAALADEQMAILNIRSIYDLDGVDIAPGGIAAHADPAITDPATIPAKFLRLIKAVSMPDEDVRDFDNSSVGVNRNQLMREILGYVPIEPDGSVRAVVPANVPFMISVVDETGKRINIEQSNVSLRHQNWLYLNPGSTLDCRGCHARNSTAAHGRPDAQAPSVHLGGTLAQPYPNTEPLLFAPNGGETMAEIFSGANGIDGRALSADLSYNDDWTDDSGSLVKAPSFELSYANLDTASPASAGCDPSIDLPCRIVINYESHIQPIWELPRAGLDDGMGGTIDTSCTGCHTTNGGTQVPAAQLDLTATPSDIDADHFTSYRELLRDDQEQSLNGMAVANRLWECNVVDPDTNMPVIDDIDPLNPVNLREFRTPANIGRSMTEAGANFGASNNFFNCLTQNNACRDNIGQAIPAAFPDECIEFAGDPVIAEPTINHNGMLTADELRLIAEWLDIGAQYYNNPFEAPE